jgi:hypothetical protein
MDQHQLGAAFAAAHLAELRRRADRRRVASSNRAAILLAVVALVRE